MEGLLPLYHDVSGPVGIPKQTPSSDLARNYKAICKRVHHTQRKCRATPGASCNQYLHPTCLRALTRRSEVQYPDSNDGLAPSGYACLLSAGEIEFVAAIPVLARA